MKKMIKMAAGISLLAGLTFGTSVTAWAANEWVQEGDRWYYLDSNNAKAASTWKHLNGNYYCFDENGYMRTGWHFENDNAYYLGDKTDGKMKTGWVCLSYDPNYDHQEGEISAAGTPGAGSAYYYFDEKGRMTKAEDDDYVIKTLDGDKYCFDREGVMQYGWVEAVEANDNDTTGISKFKYFGTAAEGKMVKGWRELSEHPSDETDSEISAGSTEKPGGGETYWYYFDNNGVPKYLKSNASSLSSATTKVGAESYFFDEYGCMQTGLIGFSTSAGTNCAYFDSNGAMKTGKVAGISDDAGENTTFYFSPSGSNKGLGHNGEKDGYLYYMGQLVKANADYEVFEVNDKLYLVNKNGKVQDSKKYYKVDGEYRYYYASGTIYLVDSDKERQGEATADGELPENYFEHTYSLN